MHDENFAEDNRFFFAMSPQFPEVVDCFSKDIAIAGRYKLTTDACDVLYAFSKPLCATTALVYEKLNSSGGYMIYCEGIPELLPGEIWESVVSDALSRHAEANMTVEVSRMSPEDLLRDVCRDIVHVATEASKDLVGWVIVSYQERQLSVLGRCVQRIEEIVNVGRTPPALSRTVSQWSTFIWEVRRHASSLLGLPGWLVEGLSSSWTSLIVQPGCFAKDDSVLIKALKRLSLNTSSVSSNCSTMASPPSSPVTARGDIKTVAPNKYEWSIGSVSGAVESEPIHWVQGKYTIILQPPSQSQLISLTLCRHESVVDDIVFSICLGGAKSGKKKFSKTCNKFEVLFHPKAVLEENLSATLEFY